MHRTDPHKAEPAEAQHRHRQVPTRQERRKSVSPADLATGPGKQPSHTPSTLSSKTNTPAPPAAWQGGKRRRGNSGRTVLPRGRRRAPDRCPDRRSTGGTSMGYPAPARLFSQRSQRPLEPPKTGRSARPPARPEGRPWGGPRRPTSRPPAPARPGRRRPARPRPGAARRRHPQAQAAHPLAA